MATLTKANVPSLSVLERIPLFEDIWDAVAELLEAVDRTEDQKAEIDHRLDAYHRNPDEGSPWGMVRERIRSKR